MAFANKGWVFIKVQNKRPAKHVASLVPPNLQRLSLLKLCHFKRKD